MRDSAEPADNARDTVNYEVSDGTYQHINMSNG